MIAPAVRRPANRNHGDAVIVKSSLRRFALALGVLMFLFAPAYAPAQSETESEAALLARIEDYLNAITTMQANFMQVNHDGSISEGTLVVAKPGLMRIDYQPPIQVRIISDGKWITYIDGELGQVSQAPLNGSHAELLLRDDLRFGGDIAVTALFKPSRPLPGSTPPQTIPGRDLY